MVWHLPPILGRLQEQTTDIVLWGGLVLLAAVLVGLVMLWLRRKYREGGDSGPTSAFSISSLEQMRSRGEITEEEFKALRLRVLGLHAGSDKPAGLSSEPPADDDEQEAVE